MRNISSFFVFILFQMFYLNAAFGQIQYTFGHWHAELALNDRLNLPFDLQVVEQSFCSMAEQKGTIPLLIICNGEERITLTGKKGKEGEINYSFPIIESELKVKFAENGKELKGTWINYNKSKIQPFAFSAYASEESRFLTQEQPKIDFTGRWEVIFENGKEAAIGVFKQVGKEVTGTFLSETGDYRYLAGNVDANNTLFLSTFDGVHAYQFVANIYSRDSIEGIFYSGASYNTVWKGRRNDTAQLTDPDSLSEMKTHGALTFDAKTLNGKDFHFKAQENHPTIIQIMGTWCPNCMDEMNYFKEIYPKYKQNGVEIIAVSFEIGTHTKDQLKRLRQFKKRAEVPYKVLLGGSSTNKGEAAQVFKDLSRVMGFPTTIFIDEKGHVVKVHTGFSGPGTGIEFLKFKEETEQLLNKISGLQSPVIFD